MLVGDLCYDGNKNECTLSGPWYLLLSGCLRNLCFYNCLLALSLLLIILSTLLESSCVFFKVMDCSK